MADIFFAGEKKLSMMKGNVYYKIIKNNYLGILISRDTRYYPTYFLIYSA